MFFKYRNDDENELDSEFNKSDFDLKYSYEKIFNKKNRKRNILYAIVWIPLVIFIAVNFAYIFLLFFIYIYWLFPDFFIYLKHCLIKKFSKDKRQAYILEIKKYNDTFYYDHRTRDLEKIIWKNKGHVIEDKRHEIKTNDILYIIVECDGCKFEIEGIENNLAFKSLQRNLEEQKKIPIEIYVWKSYTYANLESVPKQYIV